MSAADLLKDVIDGLKEQSDILGQECRLLLYLWSSLTWMKPPLSRAHHQEWQDPQLLQAAVLVGRAAGRITDGLHILRAAKRQVDDYLYTAEEAYYKLGGEL